jgi:hypothetical protein
LRGRQTKSGRPISGLRWGVHDFPHDDAEDAGELDDADNLDVVDASERPVDRFRRTATGAVVAAGLLGMRDALEGRPEKEEVTIVNEVAAAPPRDLEVVIDPDHPERTVAVVRAPADEDGDDGNPTD